MGEERKEIQRQEGQGTFSMKTEMYELVYSNNSIMFLVHVGQANPTETHIFSSTCDGELDDGSDLALLAVGGEAGVVPGIRPRHCGEVQRAALLLHPRRDITAVCRGARQTDRHTFTTWELVYFIQCQMELQKLLGTFKLR